ncbi:MAG TPA: methyltransferase domain-containing protein [Phycisphaerae bacterium]|nr:methyltransferase domain-containing protein [Phycisphaerae bacterium]HRY70132.1 methyltransferase domain-containing protein [Phycisphaerae bacterium]HSA28272.1 methyltransferase domain-containing protein [Phycisphaerae bacterium]
MTTLNLEAEKQRAGNIMPVIGDATHLSAFGDHSFDVAFSNSVIEHLATPSKQASMAEEIQRVAVAHWVQTPNYWFPIEPHFHVPGWQWMPQSLRVAVLRRFRCGWRGPCPDAIVAQRMVAEIRLLTYRELRRLFPNSTILPERFLGVTKSWIVVGGFVQLQTSLSGQSPAS